MSKARNAILERLRAGRGDQPLQAPASDFSVVRDRDWSLTERLERFETTISSVNGEVHRVVEEVWVQHLWALMAAKGLNNLLVAPETVLGQQLLQQQQASGPELRTYRDPVEHWKSELFNGVDAALTGCRGAIAETGSLILWPTVQEPRLMSLVPPVHFVVLRADQVYCTFYQALAEQGWADQGMPTNALLISGPSKTADIEQTLAYGVHGPRELVVLVLE
ncbi:LutC/YkgG family protein [Marinobacter mobilis]|uniref:L-lactate dehydrogenase complex protein LldG n=1 Tax=Marinobacter mobilis TaxID=488533 RepID=A0A1H2SLM2_9GAMM|nr:lactate utilization protein [Marinobacter mobilis]SDW32500.1 L-lactate dehydrogenase complex protein LldG [Marinobacter mobilis]